MTTTVIGDNIIDDANKLDDFNETYKIKLYKKAVEKGQRYQKELDKALKEEADKIARDLKEKINGLIEEKAKSFQETTDFRIKNIHIPTRGDFYPRVEDVIIEIDS